MKRARSHTVKRLAVVASVLGLVAPRVMADTGCPLPAGAAPALAGASDQQRLHYIQRVLDDQGHRARQWSWAWGIAESALFTYNVVDAVVVDTSADRATAIVGAAASLIPPVLILATPLKVKADQPLLDGKLAVDGSCTTLTWAEQALERDAEDEATKASWVSHVGTVALATAATLYLGLAYHDNWTNAGITGGAIFVLGEAQIWTQPKGAIGAERRYLNGDLGAPSPPPKVTWVVAPWLGRDQVGAVFAIAH
jgi:hypothetical protein